MEIVICIKGPIKVLIAGEDVLSLATSFLAAGVECVISCFGKTEDHPTSEIMVSFHAEVNEEKSQRFALHKAKLSYLEKSNDLTSILFIRQHL